MTKIKGKIKAVSGPNMHEGVLQIGFILVEDPDKWHNIQGEEDLLKRILELKIKKGNEIEFEEDANKNITKLKLIKEAKEGSLDDLISFEELLSKAHEKFKDNFSIRTKMIHKDLEKKNAIVKAKIVIFASEDQKKKFKIGELSTESKDPVRIKMAEFEAYGDATQENCGEMVKKHWIRMAETRAIARALRWATNNAKTATEETETGELPKEEPSSAGKSKH